MHQILYRPNMEIEVLTRVIHPPHPRAEQEEARKRDLVSADQPYGVVLIELERKRNAGYCSEERGVVKRVEELCQAQKRERDRC